MDRSFRPTDVVLQRSNAVLFGTTDSAGVQAVKISSDGSLLTSGVSHPTPITQSTNNSLSTVTTITAGNTWSGTFEDAGSYAALVTTINFAFDTSGPNSGTCVRYRIGWLYVDFSTDGVTVSRTVPFRVMTPQTNQRLMCPITATGTYVRLRFAASTIIDSRGVFNTEANDWKISISTFLFPQAPQPEAYDLVIGKQLFKMQGYANGAAATNGIVSAECSQARSTYPLPNTNTQIRVANQNSGNQATGANGRQFLVIGTDNTGVERYWFGEFSVSGDSTTTCPSTVWTRINEFYVTGFGSAGTLAGTVYAEIFSSSIWIAVIALSDSYYFVQSTAFYTVPAGYNYAKVVRRTISTNNGSTISLIYAFAATNPALDHTGTNIKRYPLVIHRDASTTNGTEEIHSSNAVRLPGDSFAVDFSIPGDASTSFFYVDVDIELG